MRTVIDHEFLAKVRDGRYLNLTDPKILQSICQQARFVTAYNGESVATKEEVLKGEITRVVLGPRGRRLAGRRKLFQ